MTQQPLSTFSPNKSFWKKKDAVSFLLSILVFFIHNSSFYNYSDTGSTMSQINQFLAHAVRYGCTEFSVPLFFIISAALFFRNYNSSQYADKLKKRIKTLLIPYLAWNVVWLIFNIVTSYTFISNYFIGREKFEITLLNVLLAIFHHKGNGPFWFLFDLIFFVLLTPFIDYLTQTKRRSILSIVAVALLCLMGLGLPTEIFFMDTALVYYLIGATIGKYYLPHFVRQSSVHIRVLSLIVLLCYTIHNIFFLNHVAGTLRSALMIVQYILCAWAFWNICDWIPENSIVHHFSDCSFAVYAMHANLGAVVTKLLYLLLPKSDCFAVVNFLLTIALTLLFVKIFCLVTKKRIPWLHELLMGSR